MFAEAFAQALRSYRAHRLRSLLTAVGVMLGILLVVVTGCVGAAFQQAMINQTKIGGERSIQFTVGSKANLSFHYLPVFDDTNLLAVASTPHVVRTAPVNVYYSGAEPVSIALSDGSQHPLVSAVTATTPDFFTIDDLTFAQGGAFASAQPQLVVGAGTADQYGLHLGDQVVLTLPQVSAQPFTLKVAGILARLPNTLFGNSGVYNNLLAVPIALLPSTGRYVALDAQVDSTANLTATESGIEQRLNAVPAIQVALTKSGYQVIGLSQADNVATVGALLGQVQIFVIVVAALAAGIGGIGIANTMLVTITERTRQIGIMRAVGATRRQVQQMFLVESLVISVVGTVAGILLGLLLSTGITLAAAFPLSFAVWSLVVSAVLGLVVGTVAGLYPASRAARINIKEALAYE
ncbi:MAG TPA: ABC transporter permease [Ktedonobacterales bacterium]|nr:ABC transporter permease [Ktedonobacterales bacterium]